MPAISPLGLATNTSGSFAGKLNSVAPGVRISPLGLAVRGDRNEADTLTAAVAVAQAANVSVSVPTEVRSLAAHILPVGERDFSNKGLGEIGDLTLTGAAAPAQGEELEGSNVVVRLFEASASAIFGGSINVGRPSKGAGKGRGARGYFFEIDGVTITTNTLEEAQEILRQHRRFESPYRVTVPRPIRRVVTEKLKLDLNEVSYPSRARLVQRQKKTTSREIPERKRFVSKSVTQTDTPIPERRRFIQRNKPARDYLTDILKRRER